MDILIKNCNLISMSEERPKYEEDVNVYVKGDTIVEIGKDVTPRPGTYIIDARDKICMPGLINTHTHLSMSVFRETLDGYSIQEWLTEKIWPMEDKLTPEDIYYASMMSCIEMISTGSTTANDQYYMAEDTIRATIGAGIRLQTTRTVDDTSNRQEERLEELERLVRRYRDKYDLVTLNVGIHGLYTTGPETLKTAISYAKENELPIHMHYLENQKEVEDIKRDYGVDSPVEVLEDYFANTHTILAHAVKAEESDMRTLGKMRMNIVHCPISNLRLGCRSSKSTKNAR